MSVTKRFSGCVEKYRHGVKWTGAWRHREGKEAQGSAEGSSLNAWTRWRREIR